MFYDKVGADKETYEQKAKELVAKMTLDEKCKLITGDWELVKNVMNHNGNPYNPVPIETYGCERLGVPKMGFSDGPRGVVMNNGTCFPVSMARGASFDRDLEKQIGQVIGKEVRSHKGGNYFAGVCINLLRHPAWGRAQETYGEDPYHVGEFGLQLTEQVQDHGVMACIKHYALNNIENSRFVVDIKVDERSLHEIYLPHFKKSVVDGGAASLMGAYNKFRGDQACESKELNIDILRDMWGFEGFISSDFLFGIRDTKKAIESGMDMEMPAPLHYQNTLRDKINSGEVEVKYLNQSCERVVRTTLAFTDKEDKQNYGSHLLSCQEHIDVAKYAAESCMTLLKNDGNVLPLKKNIKKILLVGNFAIADNTGDKGSSAMVWSPTISPFLGLKKYFGDTVEIIHCMDNEVDKAKKHAASADAVLIFAGCDFTDEGECLVPSEDLDYTIMSDIYRNKGKPILGKVIKTAIMKGQSLMKGSDEEGKGVGGDRSDLGVRRSQVKMIKEIGRINPNTVVNIVSGSMIMTSEWDDCVPSIMMNWYSGTRGGEALVNILFGDVNPSGKLPFTVPHSEAHLPAFDSKARSVTYDFYHGYYLLDKKNIKPMYAFGHGLSYTTFEQSNFSYELFDDRIIVNVDVTNTGDADGKEVVQVYVGYANSSVERHVKELKGFEKVFVKAGETQTVSVRVNLKELEYFSEEKREFVFEEMDYEIYVGNSSAEENLVRLDVVMTESQKQA